MYEPMLAALGHAKLVAGADTVGFGKTYPEFWINERKNMPQTRDDCGMHVCLRARGKYVVDTFYATALRDGATSETPPGLRPEYNDRYYAAFIRDADCNRVEVVTFLDK